jgi:tRNA uridine 5-carboxymethylaminomethyl modification enzyme
MFTSRAEYRLQLREDNADLRLTETGRRLGIVDDARWAAFARKRDAIDGELARLAATSVGPKTLAAADAEALIGQALERECALTDILRRPEIDYARLMTLPGAGPGVDDPSVAGQVEVQVKYQGYIDRQRDEIARVADHEATALPPELDYRTLRGLSVEVQQRLNQHKPSTIGQASRVQGVTPAAVALLVVYARRGFDDGAWAGKQRA